ncbi:MAG: hypothetical protein UT55_C0004G0015 [Candidatus Peregrinibacteria bacterium GW2011_GWE2_39_6]|nr:MAG: hypothetical protein UT36_C0004G0072 [Candidatus Peregrinibacteria bacterium GW2011_GWF2_39_17]KKR26651.1 MAG: hypothetical protein UT55_C0004G0015 [Candidatus Peregrinibacteria bacterium GW2011_GWE2_39_6]
MGAIIGTAIGSVIGLAVAPKKGSETQKIIKNTYQKNLHSIKILTTETSQGIFKLFKKIFKREKSESPPKQTPIDPTSVRASTFDQTHEPLKKIPTETEKTTSL